jgi:hypothetical protein
VPYYSEHVDENGRILSKQALLLSDRSRFRRRLLTTSLWSRTSHWGCWGHDLPSPAYLLANSDLVRLVESGDNNVIQHMSTIEDHALRIACFIRARQRGDFLEPLTIGLDGHLWDGMHRLAALYACNVPEVDVLDFSDGRSSLLRSPVSLDEVVAPGFLEMDDGNVLREQFDKAQPYRHIFISEVFNAAFADAVIREIEGLEWSLSTTEFYEQYEVSLIDTRQPFENTALDSLREVALSRAFAELVSLVTSQGPLDVVDVACHRSTTGQQIGIHNDFEPGGEVCRFTIHLNSGWTLNDGGLFVTFASEDCAAMTAAYVPAMNSALLFEISPTSFHAVTQVSGIRPRYSIVISFRRKNRMVSHKTGNDSGIR